VTGNLWGYFASAPLAVGLDGTGKYVHWGVVQLSVANLVVIAVIVVLFVAAILIPFPHGGRDEGP
jgi:hypothetical protein